MRGSILALALLVMPLASCGDGPEAEKAAEAPTGPRLAVTAGETVKWQDVSAEVATVDQAQVFARIPGILTSLSVREGDLVKKGQVIGRIVDNQLGHQAEALKAQAVLAQAELKRVRFLHENGVYADARLEQAQAAAAAANSQYKAASAVAGQGAIVAPASGRVLRTDIPVGAPVAPGMPVAVITAGRTILRLEMPESLLGEVHAGSRVMASGIAGADTATGRVVKLYPSVQTGQVRADADVPGIDGSVIGRRLAAKVEIGTRKALLVPASYVTRRYGIDYVTVLGKGNTASQVPVQTAPVAEPGRIEILSGISAGDTLIGNQGAAKAK